MSWRNDARPRPRNGPAISTACSLTDTNGAWMWSVDTTGGVFGRERPGGERRELPRADGEQHLGQQLATGSSGTRRGKRLAAAAIRPANTAATSL